MNLRERMLKALRHEIVDAVPCSPDISIMIPLRVKRDLFGNLLLMKKMELFWIYILI